MIDSHLHFEAIFSCTVVGYSHYAGVVHKNVNASIASLYLICEFFDRDFRGKVEINALYVWVRSSSTDFLSCCSRFLEISRTDHHGTTTSSQLLCSILSNASVSASYHRHLPNQVPDNLTHTALEVVLQQRESQENSSTHEILSLHI